MALIIVTKYKLFTPITRIIKELNYLNLFIIFCILLVNTVCSSQHIVKINTNNIISIDTFIYFINSNKDVQSVDEILKNNYPESQNHHLFLFNFITYPNNWMRFSIQNPDSVKQSQILEISSQIDSVVIYEVKNKAVVRTMVTSENLPFTQREIIHRKSLFIIDFNPYEKKDFILQIVMQGTSFRAPIKISPISRFIEESDKDTTLFAIYIGVMCLIVLFSLLLRLIFSKSPIYLYYGAYVLFGLFYMLDGAGYAFQYFFPNLPQIEKHFTYVLIQGLYLFLVLFTDKFFENSKLKFWIRSFTILTLISILTILLNLIKYPTFYDFQWEFTFILLIVGCLLTFSITLINFNKNILKSILFLTGNLLVLGISIIISFSFFVNLNLNYYYYYLPALAHAIESIMILIIIIHDLFSSEKAKISLNLQFIEEKNKNLELLNKNNTAELERQKAVNDYQKELLKNQEQINLERSRIASEMHDDIGSGLTTIKYLSDRAVQTAQSEKDKQQIEKIASQSNELIRSMSEIIWSMNQRFDHIEMLTSYLRRYASEYLDEYPIEFHWSQQIDEPQLEISGEKRRALLLILKECLHNIVKHANANRVEINMNSKSNIITLSIRDNGIGFDPDKLREHGNGIHNIQKRLKEFNGQLEIQSSQSGSFIHCSLPL